MISVVIPTDNSQHLLPRCFDSLIPAAVRGVVREVIVADGGSSDATLAIADAAGAHIVHCRANRGVQMADGARTAKSDWLLFLRPETALETGWDVEAESFLSQAVMERPRAAVFRFALDDFGGEARRAEALANLRAAVLGRLGDFDEAITLYEDMVRRVPGQPKIWMSYGHALKTVGRTADSVAAYRRATALRPAFGEAWWSIANLKTEPFDAADLAAMEGALHDAQASVEDRFHLHFALGKALSDRSDAEKAFIQYAEANRLRRTAQPYEAARTSRMVDAVIGLSTPDFFAARQDMGCPAPDPIFIIGLPRAGSTLIEQILSSHSQVEGTMELPDLPALVAELRQEGDWPTMMGDVNPARLRALGEAYMERTRIQRREGLPYFIDKLPNNWLHVGLIQLILPHARIIDARRHPLDCCFSNFKQHFARGQGFSYGLEDVGRYYVDYVRLAAHFDAVLPVRVHRVIHERLLDDPEGEISALLQALDLPFEDACLNFHHNKRAVRTASSEQVRRPINREGVGQWLPYEPWLTPLKTALGSVLTQYPATPAL